MITWRGALCSTFFLGSSLVTFFIYFCESYYFQVPLISREHSVDCEKNDMTNMPSPQVEGTKEKKTTGLLHVVSRTQGENSFFNKNVSKIITMGIPRTGSTYQQVLLCVIAHLRADSVSCVADQRASLQVIKKHPKKGTIYIDRSKLLFTTFRDTAKEFDEKGFSWKGGDVVYSQRYIDFTKCPLCEIASYGKIFNLSTDEEHQLRQYMRYWSILRQCCGSQMSKWFRAELFGCPNMTNYLLEGRPEYHMCGSMNFSSIEIRFTQSPLYKLVPASRLAPRKHLKFHWSQLGNCEKSHDNVRAGIGFNLHKMSDNFCESLEHAKSLQLFQGQIN